MKKIATFLLCLFISLSAFAVEWSIYPLDGAGSSKMRSMCVYNDQEAIVVGYDSLVYKTYDGGQSWGKIIMASFYPDTVSGFDFYDASSQGDVAAIAVSREGTAPGFVFWSSDKGETWTALEISNFANDSALDKDPTFDGANSHRFYCVEVLNDSTAFSVLNWKDSTGITRNGIFKTIDTGASWSLCNTPAITASAVDGDIEFVGNTGVFAASNLSYVFKTTDAGETWIDYTDDSKYKFIWGLSMLSADDVFIMEQDILYYYDTPALDQELSDTLNKSFSTDLLVLNKDSIITFHKHDNIWATSNFTSDTPEFEMIGDGSTSYIRKCDVAYNDTIYGLGDGSLHKLAIADAFATIVSVEETFIAGGNVNIVFNNNTINISANDNIANVNIYDITGLNVYRAANVGTNLVIPTANFNQGIYIVKADGETLKILIQ